MEIIDGSKTRCDKCDTVYELEDVSALEKRNNKHYLKILCSDCLGELGVPNGYELERDITYLARQ